MQTANEVIELPKQNNGLITVKENTSIIPDDETIARLNHRVKTNGMITVKVVKPVEGHKIGDIFETTEYAVRFQLKHKSIVRLE